MTTAVTHVLTGHIVEEVERLDVDQLCSLCRIERAQLLALVEEGVVASVDAGIGVDRRRLRLAVRLQQDLGINPAGAALAIELLERIAELERRLAGSPA